MNLYGRQLFAQFRENSLVGEINYWMPWKLLLLEISEKRKLKNEKNIIGSTRRQNVIMLSNQEGFVETFVFHHVPSSVWLTKV